MKEENKTMYKCALCGREYDEIHKRAKCEMKCVELKKEQERKAAEAKKKAEKDARQQEVTAALDNAFSLVNKFIEDYGSYQYNGKVKDLNVSNMDFFPSKLWHHFWF